MSRINVVGFWCALLLGSVVQAVELVTPEGIWDFTGETLPQATVTCDVMPAPQSDQGIMSLYLVFSKKAESRDWLDVTRHLDNVLDWTNEKTVSLDYYAEQPGTRLWIKLMTDDGQTLLEQPLLVRGQPPAARQWHRLTLPLPQKPQLLRRVSRLSVYMPTHDDILPVNSPRVIYLGRMQVRLPQRPSWPPRRQKLATNAWRTVWAEALEPGAPWKMVGPPDNQSSSLATFRNKAIEFVADREGWNEFAWSEPQRLVLKPKTTYRLEYAYRVTAPLAGKNSTFYSLVRCGASISADVGWQRWQGTVGTSGQRSVIFTTGDHPDYRIIFGIRSRGGIRISNIAIREYTMNGTEGK